ncbi:amidase domain-containing protein [Ruminococcaceae bacterium OttesenSCG-928-L11]|nr:amidase domain-containing protein [Ruminococcaceae bacterium OttesenSCG-928-L11]
MGVISLFRRGRAGPAVLAAVVLIAGLTGCFSPSPAVPEDLPPVPEESELVPEPYVDPDFVLEPEELLLSEDEPPEEDLPPEDEGVYSRPPGLSPEEIVEIYFEEYYQMYTELRYIDLSGLIDVSNRTIRNSLVWAQLLNQRRQLIAEYALCYVETEAFPYSVEFIEADQLTDERISFWKRFDTMTPEDEIMLHFIVTGEAGMAYPPILAVNTEHTMRMKEIDGEWYITYHYFPGSRRKFAANNTNRLMTDEAMLELLFAEFEPDASIDTPLETPLSGYPYDGGRAAEYGRLHTESPNPAFYNIGDWMGDCANFTSQCIWAGFSPQDSPGDPMTASWYAGTGGGSPAWENVGYFWRFATGSQGMTGWEFTGASQLLAGDLVQTAPSFEQERLEEGEDVFGHSLLVVDAETLMLGQHSPGCFVYYSDMVNTINRFYRPAYVA